jgi:hypothetical protein
MYERLEIPMGVLSALDPRSDDLVSTLSSHNLPPRQRPVPPTRMTTTASRRCQVQSMRRPTSCVDAEDGPWTVIVAESPREPSSYILNVQSTSLITIWLFRFLFVLSRIFIFLAVSSPELVSDGRSN